MENERLALRLFSRVYGMCLQAPTAHLVPGIVIAYSAPVAGVTDLGCDRSGLDDTARLIAAVLKSSALSSQAFEDIMRWKYAKSLTNLGNAIEVVCGPEAPFGEVGLRACAEGEAALRVAGIDFASEEEERVSVEAA